MISKSPSTTVTADDVERARERISDQINRTGLIESAALSAMANCRVSVKPENLQKTGAFKVRGALNAVALLSDAERNAGVATFSAGNHGQGLAYAAQQAGVKCTVFMANNAVKTKVEAIRGFGAEVRQFADIQLAFDNMSAMAEQDGVTVVSPFAEPEIIAGQGTVGLEIIEEYPDVEQLVIPIGGGGLISGVAIAVKATKPDVRIVGVCAEGASAVADSLVAGKPVRLKRLDTIADGLAAPFTGERNLSIIQDLVDDVVKVTNDEMAAALGVILERTKLLVEPAGAASAAAILTGKAAIPVGAETVAILSGGNIDRDKLKELL